MLSLISYLFQNSKLYYHRVIVEYEDDTPKEVRNNIYNIWLYSEKPILE